MDCYCNVYHKMFNIKSKSKHLRNITHKELQKYIRTKHTIENPEFFDIGEISDEYFLWHNEKEDLYLVKYQFKIAFDNEFYPHIKSELQINLTIFI